MTDVARMRFGPTPWTCSDCGAENEMFRSECKECHREPRRTLSDGTQIYPGHREIKPETGQQKGYVVLAEEERAKGFVQPVRYSYVHAKCGVETRINSQTIAETYARDPKFYSGTFCVGCGRHFTFGRPDGKFIWDDGTEVGA